jgi:hypothetical protein
VANRTTALRAKAAIKQLMEARGIAGADITWDAPSRKIGQDLIYVGDIVSEEVPAALGAQRRDENYTITVLISVMRPFSADPQVVAERAFALYEELEDMLRDNPELEGVVWMAEVGGWTHAGAANNEAGWREASIATSVDCQARI